MALVYNGVDYTEKARDSAADLFAKALDAAAAKMEPSIAKSVRDLILSQIDGIDVEALRKAINEGDLDKVMQITGATDAAKAQKLTEALQDTVWRGAALVPSQSEAFAALQVGFNRLNPVLVQWLDSYSLKLIREVSEGTREAVRVALREGMVAGKNPVAVAREIKQAVGLTAKQSAAVRRFRGQLETIHTKRSLKAWGLGNERSQQHGMPTMPVDENGDPTDGIKQRRLRDLRYDATLQRAIDTKSPLSPEQVDKMVDAYQRKYVQHRAQTIARTEAIRACNVGVSEAWRQAVESGKVDGERVRKQWIVSKGERTCPICAGIPAANPKVGVRLSEGFALPDGGSVMTAPAHPNCRCTIFARLWEQYQLDAMVEKAKRDDSWRPNAHQRGYTRQWKNARRDWLGLNEGQTQKRCVDCDAPATVINHKKRHRGDQKVFWNKRGWQPMCKPCHDKITGSGG